MVPRSPSQVSFFEWVQNLQNFKWDEQEINMRLDRKMTDAFKVSRASASCCVIADCVVGGTLVGCVFVNCFVKNSHWAVVI
jgi:glutamate dehydrogenase/leucine dehydrogenase